MEFSGIIVLVIVLVYFTKNTKGKQILDNVGDAAVEISAAAKSASTALHKQCDELLTDSEAATAKAKAKAKLTKAKVVADDYSDAE